MTLKFCVPNGNVNEEYTAFTYDVLLRLSDDFDLESAIKSAIHISKLPELNVPLRNDGEGREEYGNRCISHIVRTQKPIETASIDYFRAIFKQEDGETEHVTRDRFDVFCRLLRGEGWVFDDGLVVQTSQIRPYYIPFTWITKYEIIDGGGVRNDNTKM